MNDMLESITRTEEALKALRSFLESLPPTIAALWDSGSPMDSVNPRLVQMFPKDYSQRGAMRTSATVIAKAWGGQWRRIGNDGSWNGLRATAPKENDPLGGCTMVLHWVEPALQPGPVITFEDPKPHSFADTIEEVRAVSERQP